MKRDLRRDHQDGSRDQQMRGSQKTELEEMNITAIIISEGKSEIEQTENIQEPRLPEHFSDFQKKNKFFFLLWTLLGVLAVRLEGCQYVVSKARFIVLYLLWITWPLSGFVLCLVGTNVISKISGYEELIERSEDEGDAKGDGVEVSITILCFAVLPALQAYSLKLINRATPRVLETIVFFCSCNTSFKTPATLSTFRNDGQDLVENDHPGAGHCNGHDVFQVKQIYPERLFHWLPLATILISVFFCFAFWLVGFMMLIDIETLKREWPFFALMFFYLTLPCLTTAFSLIFIRWLTTVYRSFAKFCSKNASSWDTWQIQQVNMYADKLQEVFEQLSTGFLRYTLGINMLVVVMSAVVSVAKVLQGFNMIIYLEPLGINVCIMVALCHGSAKLMAEV